MKKYFEMFINFFKPTEIYKTAVQNIQTGDILYLMQGAFPHKEIAGWQIVTKVQGNNIFITWGGNSLSLLKRLRNRIINGTYTPNLQYWEPLVINPETGYISNHGDLKLNAIVQNEAKITIYPNIPLYYICKYGGIALVCVIFLGLCFWLASLF